MMRIRNTQKASLAERTFIEERVQYFRLFHEETLEGLSDEELRARVVHGIARGRRWGLTWEYSLTLFVAHMLEISPTFDEHPAIRRVLEDASLPPDERMDAMLQRVTDDEWEAAARAGDAQAYWRAAEAATMTEETGR